jgi:DNA-binding CsgD family transcriptional regulator/tetratricopeptide (TPR) repeat protein
MPPESPHAVKLAPLVRIAESALNEGRRQVAADTFAEIALLKFQRGKWNEADEFARRADSAAAGSIGARTVAIAVTALVPAARGDLSTALSRLDEINTLPAESTSVLGEALTLHVRLIALIGLNDWYELQRVTDRAEGTGANRYFERNEWFALRMLPAWHLNQVEASSALLAVWKVSAAARDPYFHAFNGLLLDREGRHSEAIAEIRKAIEDISPADDPLGRTWVRLVAGSALSRRGDSPEEGLGLYREAREELERLGARVFVARCDSIMATSARRLGGRVASNPLATLSPHQHRVATLVADGHTNREIGELLGVATKTIDFHVSNILARLGLNGRRDIRNLIHRSHE